MIATSINRISYKGNGTNKKFTIPFKLLNSSDLKIVRVAANGTKTNVLSDYYVEMSTNSLYYPGYAPGAEEPETEQPLVLSSSEVLVLYRDVPITQEAQMPEQWPFDVNEQMHDKSCIIDQQLQDQVNRALKFDVDVAADFDPTLPIQAGYGWRVSDDGKSIVPLDNPQDVYEQCVNVKAEVTALKSATESAKNLTVAAKETAVSSAASAGNYSNLAKAWAESSTSPDGILDSKSSKTWAGIAQEQATECGEMVDVVEAYYNNVAELYDESTEYELGDLVFTSNGELYRALADVQGEEPSASYSWAKVQSNMLTTFEMDEYGDLMPKIAAQTSTIWDIDENGDVTPTAYGSGTEQHSAEEQILENQRNIAKNKNSIDSLAASKQNELTAGSNISITNDVISANIDVTKAYVDEKVSVVSAENTKQNTEISKLKTDLEFQKMLAKGITYSFQTDSTSAYTKTIPSGAKVMDLKSVQSGKSFVKNQLWNKKNYSRTVDGMTFTIDSNGLCTFNGTATGCDYWNLGTAFNKLNHKYYYSAYDLVTDGTFGMIGAGIENAKVTSGLHTYIAKGHSVIFTVVDETKAVRPYWAYQNGAVANNVQFHICIVDLTEWFGAGNEPSTPAEFEAMVDVSSLTYSEGELSSVSVENVVVKGANIWDEEWEQGYYDSTGQKSYNSNAIRSKNYISVNPNTKYYWYNGTDSYGRINYYNQNKEWLSTGTGSNKVLTTPNDCYYINISSSTTYGGTYKNDIAIFAGQTNLGYRKHATKSIVFPTECKGGKSALNAYDRYLEAGVDDKDNQKYYWWSADNEYLGESVTELEGASYSTLAMNEQNVGSVDLGTLNWENGSKENCFYYEELIAKGTGNSAVCGNLTCSKYVASSYDDIYYDRGDKLISIRKYGNLGIRDTSYTDANTFKSAMSGVIMYYELATPIRTPITNAIGSQTVEAGGSITFVGDNENYHLPIANTEEYVIALAEV